MDLDNCRTDLPVLVIYNLDPSWPPEEIQDYCVETRLLINALIEVGHPVEEVCVQSTDLEMAMVGFNPNEYIIFNWCEELPGIPHSEYRVAQSLEKMGFTFTGTDSSSLALGQDKGQIKHLLRRGQIPTPVWQIFTSNRDINWIRLPAIVKAAFEHSSIGITRESVVLSSDELVRRVHYVYDELHQPALVEEFIDGREFHVSAIGNGVIRVLPPAEIDYSPFVDIRDRLCTYEANFDRSSLAYRYTMPKVPCDLTTDMLSNLEEVVIAAYRITNCRDYARMDIRLRDGTFYLLDVNHNPDISSDNSLVMAAGLAGLSYGQLGSLFINLAAQRHPIFGASYRELYS